MSSIYRVVYISPEYFHNDVIPSLRAASPDKAIQTLLKTVFSCQGLPCLCEYSLDDTEDEFPNIYHYILHYTDDLTYKILFTYKESKSKSRSPQRRRSPSCC